jgi:8-oxo-dGTP pyrophosphatase MutT (NUDIX family)
MLSPDRIAASIQPIIARPHSILSSSHYDKAFQIAAVMIIIHYNYKTPHILLTKRSSNMQSHRCEISFPGGKYSIKDKSLRHTAIRETKEEIGLLVKHKDIIGSLMTVSTLTSNFMITPFVTLQQKIPQINIRSSEVERLIDAPMFEVLNSMTPDYDHYNLSIKNIYKFKYKDDIIWGATAKILKQLHEALF